MGRREPKKIRRNGVLPGFLVDRVQVDNVTGHQMEVSVVFLTPLAPVSAQLSPQSFTLEMALFIQSHWVGWTNHSP